MATRKLFHLAGYSLAAFAFTSLAGCDAIESLTGGQTTPIDRQSSTELEASLAAAPEGPDARVIKLRLAKLYGSYGGQAQRERSVGWVSSMAKAGDLDAAQLACGEQYLIMLGTDGPTFCALAANNGSAQAQAALCCYYFDGKANALAFDFCEAAEQRNMTQALLPLGVMYANGKGAVKSPYRAISLLESAAQDGPWQDRDEAIAALRSLPEAAAYKQNKELEKSRIGNETAAVATVTMQPESPPMLSKNGQCYLIYEITPTGLLFNMDVECTFDMLIDPVMQAAHQWRFTPRKIAGTPVYTPRQTTTVYFKVG